MSANQFLHIGSIRDIEAFRRHLQEHQISIPCDQETMSGSASPLTEQLTFNGVKIGNRFTVHPMEGWDGTPDGRPTELTIRRWKNFGRSGAKLIWGGEAVAVRHDGRANPNQLLITPGTQASIASLREELIASHRERFGSNADGDLYVGLQLTHSGRYARPNVYDRPSPIAACANPILDSRFPAGIRLLDDDELDRLTDQFIAAARLARDAGFQF